MGLGAQVEGIMRSFARIAFAVALCAMVGGVARTQTASIAGGGRIQASLDIFNLLNSSAILSQNNTFGTAWQAPTQLLHGRLGEPRAQVQVLGRGAEVH